jgi:hypothetical protein
MTGESGILKQLRKVIEQPKRATAMTAAVLPDVRGSLEGVFTVLLTVEL